MLADLAGVQHVAMMLYNPVLRVVLVSVHVSLLDAIGQLDFEARAARPSARPPASAPRSASSDRASPSPGSTRTPARAACSATRRRGSSPRHRRGLAREGIDVTGPLPGDTVFMSARREGAFDVVVAQYHDQGLIPIKYLGLDRA